MKKYKIIEEDNFFYIYDNEVNINICHCNTIEQAEKIIEKFIKEDLILQGE